MLAIVFSLLLLLRNIHLQSQVNQLQVTFLLIIVGKLKAFAMNYGELSFCTTLPLYA